MLQANQEGLHASTSPPSVYERCIICGSEYELDDEHPERLRCEDCRAEA